MTASVSVPQMVWGAANADVPMRPVDRGGGKP